MSRRVWGDWMAGTVSCPIYFLCVPVGAISIMIVLFFSFFTMYLSSDMVANEVFSLGIMFLWGFYYIMPGRMMSRDLRECGISSLRRWALFLVALSNCPRSSPVYILVSESICTELQVIFQHMAPQLPCLETPHSNNHIGDFFFFFFPSTKQYLPPQYQNKTATTTATATTMGRITKPKSKRMSPPLPQNYTQC